MRVVFLEVDTERSWAVASISPGFIALTDADVEWIDSSHKAERHEFLAVSARHVIVVIELGSLGVIDLPGPPPPVEAASTPPSRLP